MYVAVAADDRVPPVLEDGLDACAEKAVKQMDLRHSLSDLDNWHRANSADSPTHLRAQVRSHWWGHVSIHEVGP